MKRIKPDKKIFCCLIIILFFLACQKKQPQNVIEILLPKTISSLPLLELNNKYIKSKLIKTVFFQDHIIAMADFVRSNDKFLYTGFTQGLAHHHTNPDVINACTMIWGVSSLLSHDPDLKTLADFQGKTISVPFAGSPLDLQLKSMLRKQNFLGKVKIQYLPIQQSIPFLLQKKIEGICVPEPLSSKLIIEKKAARVFSFAEKWGQLYRGQKKSPQVALFMKKSYYENNKIFYQTLLIKLQQIILHIKKNPEVLAEKYAEDFNLTKEILSTSIAETFFALPDYLSAVEISQSYLIQTLYPKLPENIFYAEY